MQKSPLEQHKVCRQGWHFPSQPQNGAQNATCLETTQMDTAALHTRLALTAGPYQTCITAAGQCLLQIASDTG